MGAILNTLLPESLKTRTWTMTETASTTNSPPTMGRRSSVLVSTAAAARTPPIASEPVSPIKMSAGWALYQRNPMIAPTIAPQITATSYCRSRNAMAVRQVDRVGRTGDHQQQEHAEERDPHDSWSQDQAAVEIRHEHGLGDADVANRQDVGQYHSERQKEELVAGAQPFGTLLGDLLPVVVEAYARNDGDEQERRECGHGWPRHHHERRE